MKKLLAFILLLLSSANQNVAACGYAPNGEDVRFSLFKPELFLFRKYDAFHYRASQWNSGNFRDARYESNVYDWYHYTNKKVSLESIEYFLNRATYTEVNANSKNEFIQYLFRSKKHHAIQYLAMAKQCEAINNVFEENPWERENIKIENKNEAIIKQLFSKLNAETDLNIKRKYAFQAIRVSYYKNDLVAIKNIFETHFQSSAKDYLYYWSLYFYCFTNPEKNAVNIADIFTNSPEKREAVYYYFHDNFNLDNALKQAKSKVEIANIYAFATVQQVNKSIDNLKKIYENNPKSEALSFLILREVNKIEDWVYTPYYVNYEPSTASDIFFNSNTTITLRNRSEQDRKYAEVVLNFISQIDLKKVNNPELWQTSKIQLLFISRQYDNCLKFITQFEKTSNKKALLNQVQKIKALCITANQPFGKAIINESIMPIILQNRNDSHFLFALGRELEYKGNLADAMALISFSENQNTDYYTQLYGGNSLIEWRGNRLKNSGNLVYFYEYFDYLDFVYSSNELKSIVIKLNSKITTNFEKIIYRKLLLDKNYLLDLLGTKYLRENDLNKSLATFKSIPKSFWESNYNGWERDIYSDYTFDKNPFYSFKYTNDFIPHTEKYIVNKKSVVEHLIKYINLIANPNSKNKDYYAFLVGNCYYNMGQNGHSWMMKRIESSYWNSGENYDESYIDEKEYRKNELAIAYYQKAFQYSKSEKFKALCIRMIDFVKNNNSETSNQLKILFPQYEYDLSSCVNLESYFRSR